MAVVALAYLFIHAAVHNSPESVDDNVEW